MSELSQNIKTQSHPAGLDRPAGNGQKNFDKTHPILSSGIGLRAEHYKDFIDTKPSVGWIEVHPENYFGGGLHRHYLNEARKDYPLSLHAVGLSLGSTDPVDEKHLQKFKELIDIYEPFNVSDHASWSVSGNAHLNDLLPLPYTQETLDTLCRNIDQTQDFFGRKILVENPSTYIAFAENAMTEYELMNALHDKTGCGILLDINNIYVQSVNHKFDAWHYIDNITVDAVGEMHLAGHTEKDINGERFLIDTHNQFVRGDVWGLYEHAVRRFGAVPTCIEWDLDLPSLNDLMGEADKAQSIVNEHTDQNLKVYNAA